MTQCYEERITDTQRRLDGLVEHALRAYAVVAQLNESACRWCDFGFDLGLEDDWAHDIDCPVRYLAAAIMESLAWNPSWCAIPP
jgi:hypothetical protein